MEQYISKSALAAEIKRLISIANSQYDLVGNEDIRNRILWSQQASVCSQILSFLDTLEVKEVDLDEEFDRYCENLYVIDIQEAPFTEMYDCAKYFFELGLKAQKGK